MCPRIALECFDPDDEGAIDTRLRIDPEPPVPAIVEAAPDHLEGRAPDPGPTLERIAALLEACLANAVELRQSAERTAAAAFGRAAEAVIPALAGRGFADEIAAAARALAASAAPQTVVLEVASEEFEPVAAALEGRAGTEGIILRASPALARGQAEVSWPDGGADIDVERLTAEALRILETHLPS